MIDPPIPVQPQRFGDGPGQRSRGSLWGARYVPLHGAQVRAHQGPPMTQSMTALSAARGEVASRRVNGPSSSRSPSHPPIFTARGVGGATIRCRSSGRRISSFSNVLFSTQNWVGGRAARAAWPLPDTGDNFDERSRRRISRRRSLADACVSHDKQPTAARRSSLAVPVGAMSCGWNDIGRCLEWANGRARLRWCHRPNPASCVARRCTGAAVLRPVWRRLIAESWLHP